MELRFLLFQVVKELKFSGFRQLGLDFVDHGRRYSSMSFLFDGLDGLDDFDVYN